MRHEPNDVGALLQLRLELGNHGQRLYTGIIQIENDERRLVAVLPHLLLKVFVGFYELDFDVDLARRLLDFRQEKQVVDKREDASRGIVGSRRQWFDIGLDELLTRSLTHATSSRSAGVAIVVTLQRAVTMVHGRGIDTARQRIIPAGARATGLAPVTVLTRSLALTLSLTILTRLLGGCAVRDGSSAAAPPSTSLPSGVTGRRIRSLIHASLLSLRSHIYEPLVLATWSNVQKWPGCGRILR